MRKLLNLLTVGVLAALSVVATPARVNATDAVAMVSGGGTANFVPTPSSVTTSGLHGLLHWRDRL